MEIQQKQDIRHIADIVGEWGKWQFRLFIFCFVADSIGAFINMGHTFHSKNVDFWCSDVPKEIQMRDIRDRMKCYKYDNPAKICTEWTYNTTQFKRSIFTEFNLVCDRANYGSLTQSFFMLGYVVSGLITAHFSDKYGRKPMVFISFTIEMLGLISCGLSVNIYQYFFSRFLIGLGQSGAVLECCGPKHRSDIMLMAGIGWVFGYSLLPGVAYWLQDFRYMQLIATIPLSLLIVWFWFLHESPRWQLTNGRVDSAEHTLKKALKINGKTDCNLKDSIIKLTENLQKINNQGELEKSHNISDLVKTPNLRKYTLILWYSWIVNALIYYGISFHISDFGGNFYITFLLSGLVELPSQFLTALLLKFIGRKMLYAIFMFILAFSSFAGIPLKTGWPKVIFALLSKYAVTSSWNVLMVYGSEIYPTIIRNTGLGAMSVFGRVGAISAPFMGNLALKTSLVFVVVFYGILSLIGGLLALLLPETAGREMPDTIQEAEEFNSIHKKTTEGSFNTKL